MWRTTLGATSSQGSIAFQTAQSGGTQTIHAHDNVTFNALTATGINGDAGSINVNADNGFILAQTVMSGGVPTLGSVSANGSARLIAAGTNTGHNLTAATGNAVLSGTVVHWDNLTAGGTLDVTATAGGITVGTAISGGTQTLHAVNDIVFSQLTTTGIPGDAGDLNVKSDTGSLRGGSISANGETRFDVAGSVSFDRISGDIVKMTSSGDLTINWVSVVRELDLAADTINVRGEQIRSNPAIPLILNITGYNGGVAKYANISIDPDSIIVNQFRVVDANFLTDAHAVTILNGYVPGQLMLTTATQQVLLNNRTLAPTNWADAPALPAGRRVHDEPDRQRQCQQRLCGVLHRRHLGERHQLRAEPHLLRRLHRREHGAQHLGRRRGQREHRDLAREEGRRDVLPARSLRPGAARCAADAAAGRDHRLRSRRQHRRD